MGAWGVLAFDNDDANDWVYELEEVGDLSLVESALNTVAEAEEYFRDTEPPGQLRGEPPALGAPPAGQREHVLRALQRRGRVERVRRLRHLARLCRPALRVAQLRAAYAGPKRARAAAAALGGRGLHVVGELRHHGAEPQHDAQAPLLHVHLHQAHRRGRRH